MKKDEARVLQIAIGAKGLGTEIKNVSGHHEDYVVGLPLGDVELDVELRIEKPATFGKIIEDLNDIIRMLK
ncbi:MAG: hypothetical protein ACYSO0_00815 [Planctomycetota bacterium]|jgi:hypothetical protein